jgi:hypothetical protein
MTEMMDGKPVAGYTPPGSGGPHPKRGARRVLS